MDGLPQRLKHPAVLPLRKPSARGSAFGRRAAFQLQRQRVRERRRATAPLLRASIEPPRGPPQRRRRRPAPDAASSYTICSSTGLAATEPLRQWRPQPAAAAVAHRTPAGWEMGEGKVTDLGASAADWGRRESGGGSEMRESHLGRDTYRCGVTPPT